MAIIDKVIIIVPTYNRFKFFPILIHQFIYQTYPSHLLEMIILDDSTENIIETKLFIESLDEMTRERITYIYHFDRHLPIGEKRNLLNQYAIEKGAEYIVCFDDDDYYPPDRVAYSVQQLKETGFLICGSSILLIYYTHLNEIYKTKSKVNKIFYGHAYNGTLTYSYKYAILNKYDPSKTFGEEQRFLKNFKVGLLQLEYDKIMLCIAHGTNTVDKNNKIINFEKTNLKLTDLIKDNFIINFYKNIFN